MLSGLLALALAAGGQDAPPARTSLPVSIDRIREGLQRKPALKVNVPPPEPTFRVEIVEHPFFRMEPYVWTFAGGGVPFTGSTGVIGVSETPGAVPLIQGDVLPAVKSAIYALRERAAQHEAQQTLAQFCAQHTCVLR